MEDQTNNNVVFSSDSAFVVRSTRDNKPLNFTLKIQSFSLLKAALTNSKRDRYESHSFDAGGYKCRLALYPNGDVKRNGSAHISLYLVSADDNILSTNSEVNVVFTFLVYDILKDKYLTVQDGKIRRFHAMKTEWGFEKLVSLKTFNDASNGLLVDDCCVFGVDIFVKKYDDGKGEESDPFTVESYRWKIRLYPSGDLQAKPGFLSMFLMFDGSNELPQGSQLYVEYEMAVLSQLEAVPLKRTFDCWFGYGGMKVGRGWGAADFSSLIDLKEPTKGYLLNDTLVVEVKINVISTLKAIV
ncbi:unnamed protein product [Citrullus colocynthis]|uniref:MATH domain-containing protein n=1 Tax=Citrullus colocynthis TaxID=252529 RepID=A0ABP0XTF4_9ROSI